MRLVAMPLPLYRRASEHLDELRREFALMEAIGPDIVSVPARLQQLVDALGERFGAFTAQPTAAMREAMARGEDRIDLNYRVPAQAKEASLELGALLDEADAFCRAGEHVLTLATPADCLAFRRWYLGEFVGQIDGAEPTPWPPSEPNGARSDETAYRPKMAHASEEVVEVAETFAAVARALAEHHDDMQRALDKIVRLAVDNLYACEFAGITRVEKRKITSPASSNDVPRKVNEIQSETGEGPCIDAIKEHEVFLTGDLRNESRWPQFSTRAHEETGICSILSIRLYIEEDTMGALNLYSTETDAFDDSDVALATVFAVHASVAMSAARREEALEQKAESRDVIGRAKGILMARSGASDDEAFAMLKGASQRMNVRLREIAERIAEPSRPPEPPE